MLQSFSAAIMHGFQRLLEQHLVVAMFVPMLVGTGGNAGNQPGVMITRALGSGELSGPGVLRRVVSVVLCRRLVLLYYRLRRQTAAATLPPPYTFQFLVPNPMQIKYI